MSTTITTALLLEKLADAQTPGFQAEFDPDEAKAAGAFAENALSETDALDATVDGQTDTGRGASK